MNKRYLSFRIILCALFFLPLLPILLITQTSPFQVRLDDQPGMHGVANILVNETDEIVLLMLCYVPTRYQFIRVTGTIGPVQALEFGYVMPGEQVMGFVQDAYLHGDKAYLLTDPHPLLSGIDLSTGVTWSRRLPYSSGSSMVPDAAGNIIMINSSHSNLNGIYKFGPSGELLMKQGLVFDTPQLQNATKRIVAVDSKVDGIGNTYFVGKFLINHDTITEDGPSILIKLDPQGNIIKRKAISSHQFHQLYVADDAVYLLDKSSNNIRYNVNQNSSTYLSTLDESVAKLLKFDHDLNLLWGKTYQGENFNYLTASIQQTASGRLVMAHSTFGAFPVVLTELDEAGNILSQKGYPNYQPYLRVLSDGSLLLCSFADPEGWAALRPVITRTDTLGNTEGCPMFPTCLYAEDFSLEMDTLLFSSFEAPSPDSTISVTTSVTASFNNYCDYPPVPVPLFDFPDTLCLGVSATSASEGNRLAQAREWHLTGPSVDSVLLDSFEFTYHFTQAGAYELQQSVWVLGCRYDYVHHITVLPPLTVSIEDSLICPGEPMVVLASASRTSAFTWDTGHEGPSVAVAGSGTYIVTGTDGHCTAMDSITVTVVAELLGASQPFTLPPDTVTCLPYELLPKSSFTEQFFTGADPTLSASFLLNATGSYRIGAEVFGCVFWKVYEYGQDCHVEVYLPNSFSPNGDGINDVFEALGQGFEVLELSIYDRWGGLMHRGSDWDGGAVGQGAYTYELRYINLLSGKVEEKHGEILLLR